MARGRMISNAICRDKKLNDLSSDTSRLAFTWLVTHADREGRVHGDPAIVRSLVFPRRSDVLVEDVEAFIREWADAGLITWYEAVGDMYISFTAFDKNQVGLRKDREPESILPSPPPPTGSYPDDYRINDGLREGKLRERNGSDTSTDRYFTQNGANDIFKLVTGYKLDVCSIERMRELISDVQDNKTFEYTDELVDYLKGYCDWWTSQKNKSTGKPYQINNFAWLEKAAIGEKLPKPKKQQKVGPDGGYG